jgi:hypothetical protein
VRCRGQQARGNGTRWCLAQGRCKGDGRLGEVALTSGAGVVARARMERRRVVEMPDAVGKRARGLGRLGRG